MGVVAVFDYPTWAARYPELAPSVPAGLAAAYFAEAGLYLDNTGCGPITNAGTQLLLLNMLVAHIAALNAPLNGQASSALVGRITNASEGSVSVATEYGTPSANAAFFNQTKYGSAFWQATAGLRTMRYAPGRQPIFDGWPWGSVRPWR